MSRNFIAEDVVQSASAQLAATATPGVALTSPAVEGNAGIIVMGPQSLINAPEQWDMLATAGTGGVTLAIMCRACLPDGDQAWTFTPTGGTPRWTWLAEEWTNVSYAPIAAVPASTSGLIAPTSASTGTTGTTDVPYVACIAAVQILATGGSAWPTVAWSNGFVETDVLSVGTGAVNGDVMLRVARYYGGLNETGGWETTATFTGSMTSKTVHACIVALRAQSYEGEA